MANIGNINVGMTLDATGFDKGVAHVTTEVRTFAGDIDRLGGLLKGALTGFAGYKVGGFLLDAAKEAARAQEAVGNLSLTFGKEAGRIEAFGREISSSFNIGLNSILDAENQLGSIFSGLGFNKADVATLSEGLTKISIDMARLKETSFDVSKSKFLAGLRGEQDPLEEFGVIFNDATIKAKALQMGLGGIGRELTNQEKVLARYGFFVEQTAYAMGTAAKEAGGTAGKIAALDGAWENLKITIGETFAPAVGEAFGQITIGLKALEGAWKENEAASTTWLTGLTSELGVATSGLGTFAEGLGLVSDAIQESKKLFNDAQFWGVKGGSKAAGFLGWLIGDPNDKIVDGGLLNKLGLGQFFKIFGEELDFQAKGINEDFFKLVADGKPSEKIKKEFQRILAEADKTRKALASKPLAIPTLGKGDDRFYKQTLAAQSKASFLATAGAGFPGLGGFGGVGSILAAAGGLAARVDAGSKLGASTMGFGRAQLRGSAEAVDTELRARYGGAKSPDQLVADNTKQANVHLKKIADKIDRVGPPSVQLGVYKLSSKS